jgi:hypothetical protein
MKSGWLTRIVAGILLVIFGGIAVHAPFIVGMETLFPNYGLLIKSWKEMLMVLALVLIAVLVIRQNKWRALARDRIVQMAAVYGALHLLIALALLQGPAATVVGLAIDLRYILFFVLVYTLLTIAPEYKKYFLKAGLMGAIIIVGFGVLQLFLPADILSHIGYNEHTIQPYLTVDKNPDYIRINSTLRGPNPLGAYVVIVLGLLAAIVVRRKEAIRQPKAMLIIGTGILSCLVVLWATYSRSAVLGAGLTIFLTVIITARRLISRKLWIIGCIVCCGLVGGIVLGRDSPFITNVILHENRDGGSLKSSNDGHLESLVDGTERMVRQPIGAGVGSTGSASLLTDSPVIIENQYLFIAHEVGWAGLALFGALTYAVLRSLWQRRQDWLSLGVFASGIGLSAIGLLQPVWVDDTVAIIWWGLAAIALSRKGEQYARRKTKQKTT